jgi:mannan endo-1,4-beta-mannosidase
LKFRPTISRLIVLLCIFASALLNASEVIKPANPNASSEAQALLEFLYRISGKYTLTGQHNYPNTKDRNSQFAAKYLGKTPAVFSTDWGFAEDGDTDSYLARPDIVAETKRQHHLGSVITICWHAVPPTADEPVTFHPQFGETALESLASVQGQLLDQQFQELLTPGTRLYKRWCAQVDTIALYLKKLRDAKVPVLWRPYHEMNGDWFWWGGRRGEYSTAALYRQLFDRYVNHHKLDNLIWVWSVDRPVKPEMQYLDYFPGSEYLDVLSLDVYGRDFNQIYYDSLVALSKGKPLILGEVGNPPTLEILDNQPKWTLYVIWAGMVRNTLKKQHQILANDPRILSLEDPAYWEAMAPFRSACGLLPLPLREIQPDNLGVDFSGEWIFNEEKSILDRWGVSFLPYKMEIIQEGNDLTIQNTFIVEYADNNVIEQKLTLDGKECKSEFRNSPRIMTANWSESGDTLIIESKITFNRGGQASEMMINEAWTLQEQGKILSVQQFSSSFWGERNITMIFDKK